MFQVKLRELLNRLENETEEKISLSELSQVTGIHRNILSNLYSDPAYYISTRYVDILLNFAFEKLREKDPDSDFYNPNWKLSDRELMNSLTSTLLAVFPMNTEYWDYMEPKQESLAGIPAEEKPKPRFALKRKEYGFRSSIPAEKLWERREATISSERDYWRRLQQSGKFIWKFLKSEAEDKAEIKDKAIKRKTPPDKPRS